MNTLRRLFLLTAHCSVLFLLSCFRVADTVPPFQMHGVIEGFYGTPWSHNDRIDILRFMGRVGLGAYFYAPKNDPYHRARWREPYPEQERTRLRELVAVAHESGVEFWYAISPGLSITYSNPEDYQALLSKIVYVSELGVRHFGLFVDDVPAELTHHADREAFETLAGAHAALTNELQQDLAARGHAIALTPTTYTDAWGSTDYVRELGASVVPEVPILWTGPDVASPIITDAEAEAWGSLVRRRPLVWDNYPVNDYAPWRLFLGPVTGRGRTLSRAALGVVANPMNQAHASMIALATLADYVSNPAGYQPERSLQRAVAMLYGDDAATLEPFLEIFGDYGWDPNVFEPLYMLGDTIALRPIEDALGQLDEALVAMQRRGQAGNPSLERLALEFQPIVWRNRERLQELRASPSYHEREGLLLYRDSLDRVDPPATAGRIAIDGDLGEWRGAEWRPLYSRADDASASRIAFRHDSAQLYVALDVQANRVRGREGLRVGEGDHIALVIDGDPDDGPIGPDDLFVLLAPPSETGPTPPLATGLGFRGFMSKWLADNRALTFSEFHLSTFAQEPGSLVAPIRDGLRHAVRRTRRGYAAEVALPHLNRHRLRMSITVTSTAGSKRVWSLARRNYPANPATFAEVVLR